MLAMMLMTLIVGMAFQTAWRELQLAKLMQTTSTTPLMSESIGQWQVEELKLQVAGSKGLIANSLLPFYVADCAPKEELIVPPSRELNLLTEAITYMALLDAQRGEYSVLNTFYKRHDYEVDAFQKGRKTSSKSSVRFYDTLRPSTGKTLSDIYPLLTSYNAVKAALMRIEAAVLRGEALTAQVEQFKILEQELHKKKPVLVMTESDTVTGGQSAAAVYEKHTSYQVLQIVASDDLSVIITPENIRFSKGTIEVEEVFTQFERIP